MAVLIARGRVATLGLAVRVGRALGVRVTVALLLVAVGGLGRVHARDTHTVSVTRAVLVHRLLRGHWKERMYFPYHDYLNYKYVMYFLGHIRKVTTYNFSIRAFTVPVYFF